LLALVGLLLLARTWQRYLVGQGAGAMLHTV
jgi:hypothetical protein